MLHARNVAIVDNDTSSLQVDLVADAVKIPSIFRKDVLESRLEASVVGAAVAGEPKPAPAGGVTVKVASDMTEVETPASVFIPAGATDALISPITTSPVGAASVGTIRAAFGDSWQQRSLGLFPLLWGHSLGAETVIGGDATTGTVTLLNPAPPGGAVVTLSVKSCTAWERLASLTCTEKSKVPASVGVPLTEPFSSVRPGGSSPSSSSKLYGARPPETTMANS